MGKIGLAKEVVKHELFIKYTLTGAAVTAFELWLLDFSIKSFNWEEVFASCVAFSVGLVLSFFLRKFIVFGSRDWREVFKQFSLYTFILAVNVALNGGLMYLFKNSHIDYLLGQLLSNIILGFISYTFNKAYTFKRVSKVAMNFPKTIANIKEEISK